MGVWESSSIENNFNSIIEEINKMKEITSNKFKKLEQSTELAKIQQLKPLKLTEFTVRKSEHRDGWSNNKNILRVEWNSYDIDEIIRNSNHIGQGVRFQDRYHYVYIFFSESDSTSLNNMINFINTFAELDKENHLENVKRVTSNKTTEAKIFDILEQVGISSSYYGYKTSRSSKSTKMSHSFPSEIRKQIPTQYSENKLDELKKNLIDQVKKIWNDEIYKMKQAKVKKEKEEKEKEYNKKLALLLAKYDLELTDSWKELNEAIIDRNKYLRLAHYLEANRSDWTDGYSYADSGLSNFVTESDLDRKIYSDISSYMYEKWNGDGRVFRDCEYNYSVIYSIAAKEDPQLYKDYQVVQENLEFEEGW